MIRAITIFAISLIIGCSNNISKNTVILEYTDFGPQVIANEVIGMEWWQWQSHGESKPRNYDIKVVVYRKTALDQVKKMYPINADKEKDYRYLEYDVALAYLNEKINENIIKKVTIDLKKIKLLLVEKLGKH